MLEEKKITEFLNEGWSPRIKKVKGKQYMTLRKNKNEKSLGLYDKKVWSKLTKRTSEKEAEEQDENQTFLQKIKNNPKELTMKAIEDTKLHIKIIEEMSSDYIVGSLIKNEIKHSSIIPSVLGTSSKSIDAALAMLQDAKSRGWGIAELINYHTNHFNSSQTLNNIIEEINKRKREIVTMNNTMAQLKGEITQKQNTMGDLNSTFDVYNKGIRDGGNQLYNELLTNGILYNKLTTDRLNRAILQSRRV